VEQLKVCEVTTLIRHKAAKLKTEQLVTAAKLKVKQPNA